MGRRASAFARRRPSGASTAGARSACSCKPGTTSGPGRRVLTQGRLGWNAVRSEDDPYLALPGRAGAGALAGGNVGERRRCGGALVRWRRGARRERVALDGRGGERDVLECARAPAHVQGAASGGAPTACGKKGGATSSGRYSYASIADLEAGRPSSYSRTLLQPARDRLGLERRRRDRPPVVAVALVRRSSTARGSRGTASSTPPRATPRSSRR